jgi:hypothetical protein
MVCRRAPGLLARSRAVDESPSSSASPILASGWLRFASWAGRTGGEGPKRRNTPPAEASGVSVERLGSGERAATCDSWPRTPQQFASGRPGPRSSRRQSTAPASSPGARSLSVQSALPSRGSTNAETPADPFGSAGESRLMQRCARARAAESRAVVPVAALRVATAQRRNPAL